MSEICMINVARTTPHDLAILKLRTKLLNELEKVNDIKDFGLDIISGEAYLHYSDNSVKKLTICRKAS